MPWRLKGRGGQSKSPGWNSSRWKTPTGWQRIRKEVLKANPICRWPAGCGSASTDVHHIRAQHLGGDESPSNLLALCGPHHALLSARQGRAAQLRQRGA